MPPTSQLLRSPPAPRPERRNPPRPPGEPLGQAGARGASADPRSKARRRRRSALRQARPRGAVEPTTPEQTMPATTRRNRPVPRALQEALHATSVFCEASCRPKPAVPLRLPQSPKGSFLGMDQVVKPVQLRRVGPDRVDWNPRMTLRFHTSRLLPVPHGFTTRDGGVSEGPYRSLNLSLSVGDSPAHVAENLRALAREVGVRSFQIQTAAQVHGARVLEDGGPDPDAGLTSSGGEAEGL